MNAKSIGKPTSFGSWFSEGQELVEKYIGPVVLMTEIFLLFWEKVEGQREIAVYLLNIIFGVFIILSFNFRQKFFLNIEGVFKKKSAALKEKMGVTTDEQLKSLEINANQAIYQFGKFSWFWVFIVAQYAILATKEILLKSNLQIFSDEQVLKYIISVLVVFANNLEAYIIILTAYVLYEPDISIEGGYWGRTAWCRWILLIFIVLHCTVFLPCITDIQKNDIDLFAQFSSGIINGIVLVFLIARFETTLMEIPINLLFILYMYAALQTCLLLILIEPHDLSIKLWKNDEILSSIQNTVLSLILLGKVSLYLTVKYIHSSGRLFYYFLRFPIISRKSDTIYKIVFAHAGSYEYQPVDDYVTIKYVKEEGAASTAWVDELGQTRTDKKQLQVTAKGLSKPGLEQNIYASLSNELAEKQESDVSKQIIVTERIYFDEPKVLRKLLKLWG